METTVSTGRASLVRDNRSSREAGASVVKRGVRVESIEREGLCLRRAPLTQEEPTLLGSAPLPLFHFIVKHQD